jgi:metallo-beta-lactamase class B
MLKPLAVLALSSAVLAIQGTPFLSSDTPISCHDCEEWNRPHEPFRVFGNSYFVGTTGLGAVLIASARGHVLIDGGLPQSAALIDTNIRALGFRTSDIKLIVNSHPHFDHAGGIHALQHASGARVAASPAAAGVIASGHLMPDDPQMKSGQPYPFARVTDVRVVKDGEILRVGDLAVTAHFTPGHTPGGTTWTWRSCEGARCLDLVYADSLTAVSDDGFRFTGDAAHPSIVDAFRRSVAIIAALPCDIVLTPHPGFVSMDRKLKERASGHADAFIDPRGCRTYANDARQHLDERIASEH